MKAVTFEGPFQVAVKEVADPEIKEPTDAIIKVTAAPICGSDLHVYNGRLPIPLRGWVLGHEYIGVIEEVGGEVSSFARGDRVVGSFVANCGQCFYCQHGWPTQCLKQQHLGFGQVPGAQAQYLRVPFAPTTLAKVPDSLSDEDAVCAGDVLATGYFAAEEGNIQPGDTVVVVGCGAVGLYSIMCARLFQPATIIALDSVAERLAMAERLGALPVNVEQDNPAGVIRQHSEGRGADVVIEAVGQAETLKNCFGYVRPGGTIAAVGVYSEAQFPFPMFLAFLRNLNFKTGVCPAQNYMHRLLSLAQEGKIKPSQVITHHFPLDEASHAYDVFAQRKDGCIKALLQI